MIGSDTLATQLRDAAHDDAVKAVVLRIDSPGGSVFASEVIRREVEALRKAGKPVVASMSSLAASGGYYIAMDADKIVASPATLTGSIGIFFMMPTFQRSLERLGVHTDGVGTTALSGEFRLDRPLGEHLEGHPAADHRARLPGLHRPRGEGAQDVGRGGRRGGPGPRLGGHRREARRARGPARRLRRRDRAGCASSRSSATTTTSSTSTTMSASARRSGCASASRSRA